MGANDLLGRIKRLATRRQWTYQDAWGKGSHLKVRLNGRKTVIPVHAGDLSPGVFRKIKKDLAISDGDLEV